MLRHEYFMEKMQDIQAAFPRGIFGFTKVGNPTPATNILFEKIKYVEKRLFDNTINLLIETSERNPVIADFIAAIGTDRLGGDYNQSKYSCREFNCDLGMIGVVSEKTGYTFTRLCPNYNCSGRQRLQKKNYIIGRGDMSVRIFDRKPFEFTIDEQMMRVKNYNIDVPKFNIVALVDKAFNKS